MKRIYGSEPTKLVLTKEARKTYNSLSPITITEYLDRCYRAKPEFEDRWDSGADGLIWDPDFSYLAQAWEMEESELRDQLDEVPIYGVAGAIETDKLMTADELNKWLEDIAVC